MDDEQEIRITEVRPSGSGAYWMVFFSQDIAVGDGTPPYHVRFRERSQLSDHLAAFKWGLEQIEKHKKRVSSGAA